MKIEEAERRGKAIQLVSKIMHQIPLERQYETMHNENRDEEFDIFDYLLWIVEGDLEINKEVLLSHVLSYMNKE